MKMAAEIIVTLGIMLLIGGFILMGTVLVPLIAFLGGVFVLGLIIFFLIHEPKEPEKPEE